MMPMAEVRAGYVVCLSNAGYSASLEVRKLYRTVRDDRAAELGMIRVIDESGEDYAYPASMFAAVDLPDSVQSALAASS
jgi:hypothetical protein